ncbi:MAG: AgrD family cyclic lactone autoinducer peptide [Coprococcus sp.]
MVKKVLSMVAAAAVAGTYAFSCFFIFGQPKAPKGMERYKIYIDERT